jgi:hypothetical protein
MKFTSRATTFTSRSATEFLRILLEHRRPDPEILS